MRVSDFGRWGHKTAHGDVKERFLDLPKMLTYGELDDKTTGARKLGGKLVITIVVPDLRSGIATLPDDMVELWLASRDTGIDRQDDHWV